MSKGRRNREISYRQENDKEVNLLRELNSDLVVKILGMRRQIVVLTKENEHFCAMRDRDAAEKSQLQDERIRSMVSENTELKRELRVMECRYEELEGKTDTRERRMMYKLCDMERRYEESLLLHMKMASSFKEEKESIQEEIKRILDEESQDRRAWKEREEALESIVFSLQQGLRTVAEERENAENTCLQLKRNNGVLSSHIVREDGMRRKAEEDLAHSRKAMEALFFALKTSRDDLDAKHKEMNAMEERVRSLEGELSASNKDHAVTRAKFENLKESGGWTGVLLNRQDDRIAHLTESLMEERRRVKEVGSTMKKCMDHLTAERRDKEDAMLDLRRLHEESKVLAQGLMSAREDLGVKELKTRELEHRVQALRKQAEAFKCCADKEELRSLEGRLCEAQKESEVLRVNNEELQRENESIRRDHFTLQTDMKERMVKLKKAFSMMDCTYAQPTGKG